MSKIISISIISLFILSGWAGTSVASDDYQKDAANRLAAEQNAVAAPGWVIPTTLNPQSEENIQNRSDILSATDQQQRATVPQAEPVDLLLKGPKGGGDHGESVASHNVPTENEPAIGAPVEGEAVSTLLLILEPGYVGGTVRNVVDFSILSPEPSTITIVWVEKTPEGYSLFQQDYNKGRQQYYIKGRQLAGVSSQLMQSNYAYAYAVAPGGPIHIINLSGYNAQFQAAQLIASSPDRIMIQIVIQGKDLSSFNWYTIPTAGAGRENYTGVTGAAGTGQRTLYPTLRDEPRIPGSGYEQAKELDKKSSGDIAGASLKSGDGGILPDQRPISGTTEDVPSEDRAYAENLKYLKDAAEAPQEKKDLDSVITELNSKEDKTEIEKGVLEVTEAVVREEEYIDEGTRQEFEEAIYYIRVAESMKGILEAVDFGAMNSALTALAIESRAAYDDYLILSGDAYKRIAALLGIDPEKAELPGRFNLIPNISQAAKRKIITDIALKEMRAKDKVTLKK